MRKRTRALAFVCAVALAAALHAAPAAHAAAPPLPGPAPSLISPGHLREIVAYALPFGGAALFIVLQQNWHQYAVALSVPAAHFAVYAVGCFNLPVVDLLYTPITEVMMVRMGELGGRAEASREACRESARLFREGATRLALAFFPLAAVLLAFADESPGPFVHGTFQRGENGGALVIGKGAGGQVRLMRGADDRGHVAVGSSLTLLARNRLLDVERHRGVTTIRLGERTRKLWRE